MIIRVHTSVSDVLSWTFWKKKIVFHFWTPKSHFLMSPVINPSIVSTLLTILSLMINETPGFIGWWTLKLYILMICRKIKKQFARCLIRAQNISKKSLENRETFQQHIFFRLGAENKCVFYKVTHHKSKLLIQQTGNNYSSLLQVLHNH